MLSDGKSRRFEYRFGQIDQVESHFISEISVGRVQGFLEGVFDPRLPKLDGIHFHDEVARELSVLAPLLSIGRVVIVADTTVEEMPERYYPD